MHYLGSVDYVIIAAYLAMLIALGLHLRARASRSMEHYFIGGRTLPWWLLGVSGMASFVDMTGTMLIVSFLFAMGPRGLYVEFRGGAVLILAVMMLWGGKWHRRSGCITPAEWLVFRFGESFSGHVARIVSAAAAFLFTIGSLAYLLKGAGLFLAMFLPLSPQTCALLLIGVATCYTMASGFYGVVYADLFQSVVILAGVICVTVLAVKASARYPGDIAALAEQVTRTPEWASSWPAWRPVLPPGERYTPYRYLAMAAFFFLLKNVLQGMGSGGDPKYFGARSDRECGMLTLFWTTLMTFRWPMMMGFAVLGLFVVHDFFPDQGVLASAATELRGTFGDVPPARWEDTLAEATLHAQRYPELTARLADLLGESWRQKLQLVGHDGHLNSERVLPAVLLFAIPRGMRGLLLVSLIAAAVTTFASYLINTTAFFTNDLYRRYLRPHASNRELLAATHAFGVVLAIGGLAMAYASDSINDIWGWICMGLGTGLGLPGMLKFYWWRLTAGGINIGTVVGMIAAVVQRLYWPALHEWKQFLILAVITIAGTILGSLVTAAPDPETLARFYRTTRPFGFWGPLRQRLTPALRAEMNREHRRDVLALPFALLWQITLFLLPMQLVIGNFRSFGYTLVIFLASLTALYFLWIRHLRGEPDAPASGAPPAAVDAALASAAR